MPKIPMAETKKFCHFSNHLQHRINTGVPAKSGYIYIFLIICIYIEVFSRGCMYFSERATFNNLANFLSCPLALVIWKIHRYPATFAWMLVSTGLPKWRDKW